MLHEEVGSWQKRVFQLREEGRGKVDTNRAPTAQDEADKRSLKLMESHRELMEERDNLQKSNKELNQQIHALNLRNEKDATAREQIG